MLSVPTRLFLGTVSASCLLIAGCSSTPTASGDVIVVSSTDSTCEPTVSEHASGVLQFQVKNDGSQVTEFYVLGADGLQVLAEVENIGPGIVRDLVLTAPAGSYTLACKPGMVGEGIRSSFTVTDSGEVIAVSSDQNALAAQATKMYSSYVKDQSEQLLAQTKKFAAAYESGDFSHAKDIYANARMHWERIEPVAESFGDLDPILDAREADLAEGDTWTGWHRIEKDLWPPASGYVALTSAQRTALANGLVKNTSALNDRARELTFTVDQLGNGAKELLDEVATGKITGEEETWSHTDLWDFQANVEGAKVMYEGLKPIVQKNDPALAKKLTAEFANVQKLLDQYRKGDGFLLYTQLTPVQIKELAAAVDALGEPLSHLTSTVLLGKTS